MFINALQTMKERLRKCTAVGTMVLVLCLLSLQGCSGPQSDYSSGTDQTGSRPSLIADARLNGIAPGVDPLVIADPNPPVFQRGNELSQPLTLEANRGTITNFIGQYFAFLTPQQQDSLVQLRSDDILAFPSQQYDHASLNLTNAHPNLHTNVLYTGSAFDNFITASNCRECHDASQTLANQRPRMAEPADHGLNADWSEYGEWSASLMALSARDPVFHAQVESEAFQHPRFDRALIDNVCYSCHGAMGQKQLTQGTGNTNVFNHYMIYSTPDNFHPQSSPYNQPGASRTNAVIGALARDGVSCQVCHQVDGLDAEGKLSWDSFYGAPSQENIARETTGAFANEGGFDFPFTSNFKYDFKKLIVPDDGVSETEEPMHLEGIAKASKQPYLKQSQLCGTCHVVIVPKVPRDYAAGIAPLYDPPKTPNAPTTYSGDPFTDPLLNLAFEQTTYLEYLNSHYPVPTTEHPPLPTPPNPQPTTVECQTCHMPGLASETPGVPRKIQVSSIGPAWYSPNVTQEKNNQQVRGTPDRTYSRHRLLGINLFLNEMFQQFYEILGIHDPLDQPESKAPMGANLLNAEQSIVQHATNGPFGATVALALAGPPTISNQTLRATVQVSNYAGHKFPTGAGFRRGFIEFQVLDSQGKVLWASGGTDELGIIVDTAGNQLPTEFGKTYDTIQHHHEVITSDQQVQIYEVRTTDMDGQLTSLTLSLFTDVKDNRLMPIGWNPNASGNRRGVDLAQIAKITAAKGAALQDPFYTNATITGADEVTYEIDVSQMPDPASVLAIMHYQTIPPAYLQERFQDGYQGDQFGSATERLIYVTSRLNTNLELKSDTPEAFPVIQDWTMNISQTSAAIETQ